MQIAALGLPAQVYLQHNFTHQRWHNCGHTFCLLATSQRAQFIHFIIDQICTANGELYIAGSPPPYVFNRVVNGVALMANQSVGLQAKAQQRFAFNLHQTYPAAISSSKDTIAGFFIPDSSAHDTL